MKNKILGISSVLAALLVSIVSAQGYNCPGYGMMGGFGGGFGLGAAVFSWIIGALVIVALVLFIIWIVRQLQKKR